jgi:signal transduction histidine kinase
VSDLKLSLKKKLSLAMLIVVLLTVALISFLTGSIIKREFKGYISRQQQARTESIISSINHQYREETGAWNVDLVYATGMAALNDGYIIKVLDSKDQTVWDAQAHDMSLCEDIMKDISERMNVEFPQIGGSFQSHPHDLTSGGQVVGSVSIGYYEPFFLNENDFRFLDTLNIVIAVIGLVSLGVSIIVGFIMATGLSRPLRKTVEAAAQISGGNYKVRLADQNDTLEIGMLMQSINNLAASLEQQEGIRKQLVEDVSHEIRTPVAILQTHIEAMLEGIWQPSAEHLQSCHDEVIRIGQLMKDIESLNEANSSNLKLQKSEFGILEAIHKALAGFEVEIGKKGLRVTLKGDDHLVTADKNRIGQVLVNLLSNAVKYSKSGGTIDIETIETASYVVIRVKDDGMGIPEKELPFIFERFYRADKSRNRKTGGSGIGLSIVKYIVEAHGGKVSASSEINKGSTFEIMLPK